MQIAAVTIAASEKSRAGSNAALLGWGAAGVAAVGLGLSLASPAHSREARKPAEAPAQSSPSKPAPGAPLPSYTKEEVAKHKDMKSRIWVTYKDGVFDVTDFIQSHPGGAAKIMMAAGGSVEPFWAMYQQHTKAEVRAMLEQYRIGRLEGYSAAAPPQVKDPYSNEPARHPALLSRSDKPCNAETPLSILHANLITPTDLFYVRNHLPVPDVDAKAYKLVIEGEGLRTVELSLHELKTRFKKHTVAATIQCAGNRRNEMKAIKPVKGLDWEGGAIGTAVWGGARLRDVLVHAGLTDEEAQEAQHIHFVGLDADAATGDVYAASVPLDIAASPSGDVLLAYEMNGQDLTRDHGYPVRAVVPGVVGARNVKWLAKVVASRDESPSHWQQRDYKSFNPDVDWDTVDWGSAPAIQRPPVTSAVCEPAAGGSVSLADGEVTMRGYAWSGGGNDIVRVDVSADGGRTWSSAALRRLPQRRGRAWAWTLWEATVPLPQGLRRGDRTELVAKAVDAAYNTQPDGVRGVWNLRGVVNNAWHRVPVVVDDTPRQWLPPSPRCG